MSTTFREADFADVAVLAELNGQLIRDEGHRNPMTETELAERMRLWLAGEYRAFVFESDGEVAGYALFRDDKEFVYLRQFFVVAERRRLGIGRAAVDWLLSNAWGDARRIRLDVLCDNSRGIAFWRRVGFGDYCLTMERELPHRRAEAGS